MLGQRDRQARFRFVKLTVPMLERFIVTDHGCAKARRQWKPTEPTRVVNSKIEGVLCLFAVRAAEDRLLPQRAICRPPQPGIAGRLLIVG